MATHYCKYCGHTARAEDVTCSHCRAKLELIRRMQKLIRDGVMRKGVKR